MAGTLRPGELGNAGAGNGATAKQRAQQENAPTELSIDVSTAVLKAPVEPSTMELTSSALEEVAEPAASGAPGSPGAPGAPGSPGAPQAPSLIGSLISGRYRVHELLGQGGMGAVYRGEQVHLRKRVAIKLLRPNVRKLPELVARFEREAVAGAHVQHPNVVSAIDFGQLEDKSYFLVLEYVEGTPLKDVITSGGPIPVRRALTIARQIASALQAAHEKDILHRDVKPQNVLITPDGQVKVIDFGLAKVNVDQLSSESRAKAPPAPALTVAGEIFGTLAYLAPEAIRGMEAVDARADLYALGLILYEMLAGRHPFDAKDAISLFKHQSSEDAPPINIRTPGANVPPQVERIVMRLIQRDPELRYPSATEVIAAIDEALASLDPAPGAGATATPVPAGPPAPAGPSKVRALAMTMPRLPKSYKARWVPVAAAAAALVLIAGTVALLRGGGGTPGTSASAQPSAAAPPSAPSTEPAAQHPANELAEVDGRNALAWRAELGQAVATRRWVSGAQAVLALAQLDPKLLMSKGLREEVLSAVAGIAFEKQSEIGDKVFNLLTNDLGSDGLDLLFDLVRARGGTKGGQRAAEILARPEVMARASPALRVVADFRKATCSEKRGLFVRATKDGDERILYELQLLHGTRCKNKNDPCCFREDKDIADAIAQIKARLGL